MLITVLACGILGGCTNDLISPADASDVSASVAQLTTPFAPVAVSLSDSTLSVGDTVRAVATARNTRTRRDVTRELRFRFTSSDTSVAVVDRRGLISARGNGTAVILVRTLLGRADVTLTVGAPDVSPIDTDGIMSLPATPDSSSTPPEPAPPVEAPPMEAPPVEAPPVLGATPPFSRPMLPAASVNISMPRVSGRSIRVPAGDNAAFQAALNSAVGGDEIVLPNGGEWLGNFSLPKHGGAGSVIIRSETIATAVGTRMTPAGASGLARIVTPNVAPAIAAEDGSSGWRLVGLHISLRAGAVDNYGIVVLGRGSETALSQLVSDIVLDRVFITGGETGNSSRCVAFNGNSLAVVDSWLAECHAKGRDAQGIGGWSGQGPFLIENNHIEGSGQNVMFGGADPAIANLTPSDITIRGNHFFKPMSWANGRWTVKAAFELKHARRVLFEGNVIENHWADAQTGFAVLFQAVSQDNKAPWSKIADVTVQNNIVRRSTSGINILSRFSNNGIVPDEPTRRILIRNNLFLDVGRDPVSGAGGRLLQLMGDHEDVTVSQNTYFGARANNALMFDGEPNKRLMLFNNLFASSEYGIMGSGFGEGSASLSQFAPKAIVEGNALPGLTSRFYPAGNSFPAAVTAADFVNAAGGDYTLRSTVAFSAHAGTIVGVNGQALASAVARTVTR